MTPRAIRIAELLAQKTTAERKLRTAVYQYVDWREQQAVASLPIPPAALRYRVHGDFDLDSFLATGRQCSQDIRDALARVDRDLSSFERVLDFGCGCGRTL